MSDPKPPLIRSLPLLPKKVLSPWVPGRELPVMTSSLLVPRTLTKFLMKKDWSPMKGMSFTSRRPPSRSISKEVGCGPPVKPSITLIWPAAPMMRSMFKMVSVPRAPFSMIPWDFRVTAVPSAP